MKKFLILAAVLMIFYAGCKKYPVTSTPDDHINYFPNLLITAEYDYTETWGCYKATMVLERHNYDYSKSISCNGAAPMNYIINADTFHEMVYIDHYLNNAGETYTEVPIPTPNTLPAGTTHCYVNPTGVFTVCGDDWGRVTVHVQDYTALGLVNTNNVIRTLKSYEEIDSLP